ncbi:MAG: hypothetical protein LBT00_08965 [Spirochaetaceae bacterium]|nr:hypothetical protein [Spirochaetaceae bacterium]
MRGAKRRSNPDGEGRHTGLLRYARNDGRLARNDRMRTRMDNGELIRENAVIARRRRATFGSQCRRRSNPDRERLAPDCFAPLAMTACRGGPWAGCGEATIGPPSGGECLSLDCFAASRLAMTGG